MAKRTKEKKEEPGKRGPKKKQGKTRRDGSANTGLTKFFFSRIKQEFHDIDYVDKLNDEEKAWLSSFMEEDLGANFKHKGKRIYRKKQDKLDSYRRNNKRNVDEYSVAKATGKIIDMSVDQAVQQWQENYNDPDYEDRLIAEIDKKSIK